MSRSLSREGIESEKGFKMKLTDFIHKDAVCINLKSNDKISVLYELVDILIRSGEINSSNREKIFNILLKREKLGSTSIGNGVAILHGRYHLVKRIIIAIGLSRNGIDFNSIDGKKTYIFFLLIVPLSSVAPHLKVLVRVSRLVKNKTFWDALINAKSQEDVITLIAAEERNF